MGSYIGSFPSGEDTREQGRAKDRPSWRQEKGSDGQEDHGPESRALQHNEMTLRTDPCLAKALGGSPLEPSSCPLRKWASGNRLGQNCSPGCRLTPPSLPDQAMIPLCPGAEGEVRNPLCPERGWTKATAIFLGPEEK